MVLWSVLWSVCIIMEWKWNGHSHFYYFFDLFFFLVLFFLKMMLLIVCPFFPLIFLVFGFVFLGKEASIFYGLFKWLANCWMMACKMAKIQKLTHFMNTLVHGNPQEHTVQIWPQIFLARFLSKVCLFFF